VIRSLVGGVSPFPAPARKTTVKTRCRDDLPDFFAQLARSTSFSAGGFFSDCRPCVLFWAGVVAVCGLF
jgi:hypothetical protein